VKLPFISLATGYNRGVDILRQPTYPSALWRDLGIEDIEGFNSFQLWDLYKDVSIQTAINVRNNSLFGGGWKAEFEGEVDDEGKKRTIQASKEVHDYMNKVMTPFARDLVRHLDCFGMAPVRITYNNGVPTPTIPTLGTYEVEMWINKEGQTKYTFIPDDNDEDDSASDSDEDMYTDDVGKQIKVTYDVRRAKKEVTSEHVAAARLALSKKGDDDVFLNAQELRIPFGRQYGAKQDTWSDNAILFAKLYKRWRDGIVTVRTLDISETVFFIVLDKPDYHTGQFTSKMMTLAPLIKDARTRRACIKRAVNLQTRKDIYYEDNKTMNKISSASLSNATVDAENAIGRSIGDPSTVSGFQMNAQVFYESTTKDERNELTVAQKAYQDEADIKFKMLEGFASRTGEGDRPRVVFKHPDGYVTPGFQVANLPQTEAKLDYAQMHEQFIMEVSSLLAVPSSAYRQNTSSKGIGGGSTSSGMSDMHTQTSETNLDSWTQIISDYVLTIMRMIFIGDDEAVTHALNLPDFNVPEKEIFVEAGRHQLRPMVSGVGGLNADGKFNDYERFIGTTQGKTSLLCATTAGAENDNESGFSDSPLRHEPAKEIPVQEQEQLNPDTHSVLPDESVAAPKELGAEQQEEEEEEEEELAISKKADEEGEDEKEEEEADHESVHPDSEHKIAEDDKGDNSEQTAAPENVSEQMNTEQTEEEEKEVEEEENHDTETSSRDETTTEDDDGAEVQPAMFSEYRSVENETIKKIKLEYRLKKMKRLKISLNRISNKPPDDILALRDNGVLDPHEANNILLRRYNIHATHANVKYAESMKRNWRYPEEESDDLQHKRKK
jgi:hypothetical protein